MAEFFPRQAFEIRVEGAEKASNEPELLMRAFLEDALRDRPWIVIQNLLVQDPDGVGTREIDFMVVDPERGFIIIEVKGGDVGFDAERGWHRMVRDKARLFDRDPPTQAIGSMYALVRALQSAAGREDKDPHYLHGWFVALVDAHVDFQKIPLSARNHVLHANHCRNPTKLVAEIEDAFVKLATRYPEVPRGANSPMRRLVDRHILPSMKSALYVRDEITNARVVEHDVMRPVRGIIDAAHRLDRLHVEGYAGTGKTYAALYRARREMLDGRRTLVTCFNEPLARELGTMLGARELAASAPMRLLRADACTVANLHTLAACVSNGLGRTPASSLSLSERYDAMIATLVDAARKGEVGPFDSIVVDEGQDFTPAMLDAIEALAGAHGRIAFFQDPNQSIFSAAGGADIERRFGRALVLRENLRNSASITAFLKSLDAGKLSDLEALPTVREGQPVVVAEFDADDQAGQRSAIHRIVRHLVDGEDVRPEDIVILSPFRQERGVLANETTVAGIPLVPLADAASRDDTEPPCIRWATLHRFKGLEAPAVILHDVSGSGPNVAFEAIFTACSRAQHALYVLRTRDYAGDGRGYAALPVQGKLP